MNENGMGVTEAVEHVDRVLAAGAPVFPLAARTLADHARATNLDTPPPPTSRATIGVSAETAHRQAEALRQVTPDGLDLSDSTALYAAISALSAAVPAGPAGEDGDEPLGTVELCAALVMAHGDAGVALTNATCDEIVRRTTRLLGQGYDRLLRAVWPPDGVPRERGTAAGPAGEGGEAAREAAVQAGGWAETMELGRVGQYVAEQVVASIERAGLQIVATSPRVPVTADGTRVAVNDVVRDTTGAGVITHVVTDAAPGSLVVVVDRWDADPQQLTEAAGPAGEGGPRRGSAVEAWLKARRDRYDRNDSAKARVLDALKDLRVRSDLGAPWSGRMVDYGDGCETHVEDEDLFATSPQQPAEAAGEGGGEVQIADWPERPSNAAIARMFHEEYERLAPLFGYRTREESAKPWAEVPERNRNLMGATVGRVMIRLFGEAPDDDPDEDATSPPASLAGSTTPGAGEPGRDLMERAAAVLREHHPDQGPEDFAEKVHAIYAPHLTLGAAAPAEDGELARWLDEQIRDADAHGWASTDPADEPRVRENNSVARFAREVRARLAPRATTTAEGGDGLDVGDRYSSCGQPSPCAHVRAVAEEADRADATPTTEGEGR